MLLAIAYRLPGDPAAALRTYLRVVIGFMLILAGAILLTHLVAVALVAILPTLLEVAAAAVVIALYAAATKPRPRR